jgi:hypothetical protein
LKQNCLPNPNPETAETASSFSEQEKIDIYTIEQRANQFIEDYWKAEYENSDINAMKDKLRHIDDCNRLVEYIGVDPEKKAMLIAGMKLHDLGRYWQYKMIGSFNDRISDAHHQKLGAEYIEALITSGEIPQGRPAQLALGMCRYHGKDLSELDLSDESREYIELVSAIDRIQNSCIGATGYLEREKHEDAKGWGADYMRQNPNADYEATDIAMAKVSDEVWTKHMNKVNYLIKTSFASLTQIISCSQHYWVLIV